MQGTRGFSWKKSGGIENAWETMKATLSKHLVDPQWPTPVFPADPEDQGSDASAVAPVPSSPVTVDTGSVHSTSTIEGSVESGSD